MISLFREFTLKKNLVYIFFSLILVTLISDFGWTEETYNPNPIIFVHGYNVVREKNKENLWYCTRFNFKKYFENTTNTLEDEKEFKYLNEIWDNYMTVFDYRTQSNGDINAIADDLMTYIDEILRKLPTNQERKVIIVSHSMGGLVVRHLLAKDPTYKEKIKRVVFIGTPHLGSPLATGVILADRMIPKLEEAYGKHHKWTGIDRNLDCGWQSAVYSDRDKQITDAIALFNKIVNWDEIFSVQEMLAGYKNPYRDLNDPNPGRYDPNIPHFQGQSVAVGQLAVPANVKATKTFIASATIQEEGGLVVNMVSTEPLSAESSYDKEGKEGTFLCNNVLLRPDDFKTIEGTRSLGAWIMRKTGGALFKSIANYTGLPSGHTFDELDDGDGIVTPLSQTAIGGEIFQVKRSHFTETSDWETILQAIDDKPMIEDIHLVRSFRADGYPEATYIIVKARDYLLADIEFETNIHAVNLEEYRDDPSKPYKPYFKFGKDFLREHTELMKTANGAEIPLRLQPGEFYLEVKGSLYNNGWVRLKNPAGKETECEIYVASDAASVERSGLSLSWLYWNDDPPELFWNPMPNYSGDRLMAYTNFLSMPERLTITGGYGGTLGNHVRALGGYCNCDYSPARVAYIGMEYLSSIAFNLNITDKKIRSVKFAGSVQKGLEGAGEDFKISVYRDTSNIWPVTLDSRGDKLLFEFGTLLYQDSDSFETVIDPSNLNLNGYNVWQSRSDIPIPVSWEDNIIPASIPNEGSIRDFYVFYKRSFYINNPVLIVSYE